MLHEDAFEPIWRVVHPHRSELVCPITGRLLGWVSVDSTGPYGVWRAYLPGIKKPIDKTSALSLEAAIAQVELFALFETTTTERNARPKAS